MKNWSFGRKFLIFLFVGFFTIIAVRYFMTSRDVEGYDGETTMSKNQILNLEINGVIMNGKSFLKKLMK